MPAQATPMLSVILKTFLAPLLMTKVPYAYRRSDASKTPSLQTMPIVVAPGIQRSSLKRKDGGHSPHVALKLATRGSRAGGKDSRIFGSQFLATNSNRCW